MLARQAIGGVAVSDPAKSLTSKDAHRSAVAGASSRNLGLLQDGRSEVAEVFPADEDRQQIVVAADGSGDFSDLQPAIGAAAPGALVLVRPGRYQGGVLIERPIELRGDGERESIVIARDLVQQSAYVHALTVRTDTVLRGLTIEVQADPAVGDHSDAYDDFGPCAVFVERRSASLLIEDCELLSAPWAAVAIAELGTSAGKHHIVRDSTISSSQHGIYCYLAAEDGIQAIERCVFRDNSIAVWVARSHPESHLAVSACVIVDADVGVGSNFPLAALVTDCTNVRVRTPTMNLLPTPVERSSSR